MTQIVTTPTTELAAVDVRAIERELAQLWRAAVDAQSNGGVAMMRACVINLVMLTDHPQIQRATEIVARLTAVCPNRAIVAATPVVDATPVTAAGRLDAWVQAHCHMPAPGQAQVCGEQITVIAHQGEEAQIPGIVLALLEPDVPVVLWWAYAHLPGGEVLAQLQVVADRLVIDTSQINGPAAALAAANAFVAQGVALSDLTWGRLTPWREQIAQLFDGPPALQRLRIVERIIIEYTAAGEPAALLLAGWIAARLEWTPETPLDDVIPLRHADGSATWLELLLVEKDAVAGIISVALFSPDSQFVVYRGATADRLSARAIIDGLTPLERAVRLPEPDDAILIVDELRLTRRDPIYEAAVQHAARLAMLHLPEQSDTTKAPE